MLWEPAVPVPQAFGRPCSLLPISGPLHMLTSLSLWRILALLTPLAMTEVSYPPVRPSLGRPYRVVSLLLRGLISVDHMLESFVYYCHLPLWKCKQASTGSVCHPVSEPQRVPRKC